MEVEHIHGRPHAGTRLGRDCGMVVDDAGNRADAHPGLGGDVLDRRQPARRAHNPAATAVCGTPGPIDAMEPLPRRLVKVNLMTRPVAAPPGGTVSSEHRFEFSNAGNPAVEES